MVYQALYRVYRPQTFDDMVGQSLISTTLKNAVTSQKISHAYLFSGPRGTGKTSAAKIFAKAINCPNQKNGQPCNQCDICSAVTNGSLSDVIEIDAASNNGVEEIRDIRDKSRYAPTQATYKVYIIDEVHMLTTGAFNALLKTLEEPTKNVVFILATTEVHKIPETILSRVQRFEFKRIATNDIEQRLIYVLNEQKYEFDNKAVQLIARSAKGGMRDALSLLDQALSYINNKLSYEDALQVSGSVSTDVLLSYVKEIYNNNVPQAIRILNEVLDAGKDVNRFIEELLLVLRDVLVAKVVESDSIAQNLANEYDDNFIYFVIDTLSHTQLQMKQTLQQELYMEMATIKLAKHEQSHIVLKDNTTLQKKLIEDEIASLKNDIKQLTLKLEQSQNGYIDRNPESYDAPKRQNRVQTTDFDVNLSKVFTILSQATYEDKNKITEEWDDILSCLDVPQRAKMNASIVLAASKTAVVVGFEYPILCAMTQDDKLLQQQLSEHAMRIIQHPLQIECIPNEQWKDVRQKFIQAQRKGVLDQYMSTEITVIENNQLIEEINESISHDSDIVAKAKELFGSIVEVEEN